MRQNAVIASLTAIDRGPHRLQALGVRIENLPLGVLMRASGYIEDANGNLSWHGTLEEVEERLTDLREKKARILAHLAELCLDDEQRAAYDAAREARAAILQTLPVRKLGHDGLRDKYPDGRVVWLDLDNEEPETAKAFTADDIG